MSNGVVGGPGNAQRPYLLRYPLQKGDVIYIGLLAALGVVAIVVAPASWHITNALWVFVILGQKSSDSKPEKVKESACC